MGDWFMDGFVAANMRETWAAGVKAWVHLYYHEYTDATQIEPEALRALLSLYDDWVSYDADALDLIREAEKEINDAGGVMSATTNERHPVKTPSAWEEN